MGDPRLGQAVPLVQPLPVAPACPPNFFLHTADAALPLPRWAHLVVLRLCLPGCRATATRWLPPGTPSWMMRRGCGDTAIRWGLAG